MSEFTVCRTLDTHPALRYCLLLDDMRIAGGKPDYRGDNILISWHTKETYGSVDAIKSENKQLATEKAALERRIDELCQENERLRQQNAKLDELLPENERWFSFDVIRSLNDERDQLADENAQLRELVHGFAIYRHFDCQHCGYREQCEAGQTNCYKAYVDLIKRARQMGIEVNA